MTFERPAELVEVSERLYRQIFAVGLWVAAIMSAFATLSSLLQPTPASQLRGFIACGVFTAVCIAATQCPDALYSALRRQPWWLLGPGIALGAGAALVGEPNFQLFLPIIGVIGVAGIATPRHVVTTAGLIAAVGLASPQLLHGHTDLGGPLAVLVPPLLFWLIVERIAGFTLRLHQSLASRTAPLQTPPAAEPMRRASPPSPQPARSESRGLLLPRVVAGGGVPLTARQLEVLLLRAEGLKHEQIAACLGIGAATVGKHLKRARVRTGVATDAELVAWAKRAGIVPGADNAA